MNTQEILQRLEKFKLIDGNCWRFDGSKNDLGYGQIRIDGTLYRVNRLSCFIFHGLDLNNNFQLVLHKDNLCQFKDCWNPEHLYIGTKSDNTKDLIKTGWKPFGGKQGNKEKKTHCPKGHEYTKENCFQSITDNGVRCRTCERERSKLRRLKSRNSK